MNAQATDLPAYVRDEYPFTPKSFTLADGARMNYVDEGTGPVILMLHGNPTWSFMYRHFVQALSATFRCIVPDHIGCGLSDKPQDYPYRLAQHIDNVEALLAHLGVKDFNLIAHDWGGAIGMGVAGRAPERTGRIQLMNTAAYRSQHIPWRIAACRMPVLGELMVRGLNAFAGSATYMAVKGKMPPALRSAYTYPYSNWHDRIATHRFVEDIPLSPKHPSYAALEAVEQNLSLLKDKPMHLLWGMRDFCFSPHFLERFSEFFPQAQVTRFANAGHYVFEDARADTLERTQAFFADQA